jgi:methylphosphotriester-DNA--protein-cysteine methyltransferase
MNRRTIILLLLLVLPIGLYGCSGAKSNIVVVIEKTGTYHRPDCALVKMAKTVTMTIAQARADQLKPCPACKPDTI